MKDKVVIITGAGSGIGKALAEVFAKNGARLLISGRRKDLLEQLAENLRRYGAEVLVVQSDVGREEECKALVDKCTGHFGGIDVLINNAGISMRALFETVDLKVLHQVMDVNFWGAVYMTKYALPHLIKSEGSVIGISSIAGKKGLPGRSAYSASKFALEGFLETVRTENLKKGLHVLIACPGFTASEIRTKSLTKDGTAQGESPRDESRMMSAEEVALKIYKAVLTRKRDLVLTSEGKLTVWLNKFFPSLMDKMVYNHMAKEPDSPFKS